jgi:hypothetical protein
MVRDSLFLRGRGYRTRQQTPRMARQIVELGRNGTQAYDLVQTFYLLLATLLICSKVFAKDTNCLREIPVNVVLPDAAIVRKLRPEQFTANIKNQPAPIAWVIPDNSPRRIVFVVETAKSNSQAVRRIQAAIVAEIVASARPQDSFALLTAHGARREVRFGEAQSKS